MKEYSVKELAHMFEKHEETIKRWIRSGKFPNAFIRSDKEGWKIPEGDLELPQSREAPNCNNSHNKAQFTNDNEVELIELAYQAVTLSRPTTEILHVLSTVGIKRTLKILLIMQQSATKVKNPGGFIKKAIKENWSANSTPIKLPRKKSKRLYDLHNKITMSWKLKMIMNINQNFLYTIG